MPLSPGRGTRNIPDIQKFAVSQPHRHPSLSSCRVMGQHEGRRERSCSDYLHPSPLHPRTRSLFSLLSPFSFHIRQRRRQDSPDSTQTNDSETKNRQQRWKGVQRRREHPRPYICLQRRAVFSLRFETCMHVASTISQQRGQISHRCIHLAS